MTNDAKVGLELGTKLMANLSTASICRSSLGLWEKAALFCSFDPAPFLQAVEWPTATAPSLQRGLWGDMLPSLISRAAHPPHHWSEVILITRGVHPSYSWAPLKIWGGFKEKQTKNILFKTTRLQWVKPATGLHFRITSPLKSAPFFPPAQFAKRTGINTSLRFTKGLVSWLPRDFSGKADT